jgi:hydrogenase-4 component B
MMDIIKSALPAGSLTKCKLTFIQFHVFSHVGAVFILAAFGILYRHSGSILFSSGSTIPDSAKFMVLILSFIGFGSKAGVFPFHV